MIYAHMPKSLTFYHFQESVYKFLETSIDKQGRILQKRQKGSDIKFQVVPPKKDKDSTSWLVKVKILSVIFSIVAIKYYIYYKMLK